MNCHKEVPEAEAELFASIFVCKECFRIADALMKRGERELKMLLTVLKETVRVSMVKGELQLSSLQQVEDVPKRDLLVHLSDMAQRVHAQQDGVCSPSAPDRILAEQPTMSNAPSVRQKARSNLK